MSLIKFALASMMLMTFVVVAGCSSTSSSNSSNSEVKVHPATDHSTTRPSSEGNVREDTRPSFLGM